MHLRTIIIVSYILAILSPFFFAKPAAAASSCTLEFNNSNLVVTATNVPCNLSNLSAKITAPGWNPTVQKDIGICDPNSPTTFTQGPKDARWIWLAGNYTARITGRQSGGSATFVTSCSMRKDTDDAGTLVSKPNFNLPADPSRFSGLPLFALFSGAGTGIGLLTLLLSLGLIASFIFFVLGAAKYMVSAGDSKKVEGARNQMTSAIIGLVIMAASFFIVQIVSKILGIQITP